MMSENSFFLDLMLLQKLKLPRLEMQNERPREGARPLQIFYLASNFKMIGTQLSAVFCAASAPQR
jgi:hypothetical protein